MLEKPTKRSRLTHAEVSEITARHINGEQGQDIAKSMGRSSSAVSRVVKRWKSQFKQPIIKPLPHPSITQPAFLNIPTHHVEMPPMPTVKKADPDEWALDALCSVSDIVELHIITKSCTFKVSKK
jgi:hypothetical protein